MVFFIYLQSKAGHWTLYQSFCLLLLVLMFAPAQCENSDLIPSPFALTFTPEIVLRDVTKDIRISCGYDGKTKSQIKQISRVVLLKKSALTWNQLAETKWHNTSLQALAMKKSVKQQTLLKFKLEVADHSIFGSYRCDVIGFDKMAASVTESTSEVDLPNIDLTSFLIETNAKQRRQIDSLQNEIDSLKASSGEDRRELGSLADNLSAVKTHVATVRNDVEVLEGKVRTFQIDVSHLSEKVSSVSKGIKNAGEELSSVREDVTTINRNIFALGEKVSTEKAISTNLVKNVHILQGNLSSLNGEVNFIKENVFTLDADVDSVKARFSSVDGQVNTMETQISSLAGDVNSLKDGRISWRKEMTSLKSQVSFVTVGVSNEHEKIRSVTRSIDSLKIDMSLLRDETVKALAKVASLERKYSVPNWFHRW